MGSSECTTVHPCCVVSSSCLLSRLHLSLSSFSDPTPPPLLLLHGLTVSVPHVAKPTCQVAPHRPHHTAAGHRSRAFGPPGGCGDEVAGTVNPAATVSATRLLSGAMDGALRVWRADDLAEADRAGLPLQCTAVLQLVERAVCSSNNDTASDPLAAVARLGTS